MRLPFLATAATLSTLFSVAASNDDMPTRWDASQVYWTDYCTKSVGDCCSTELRSTPETSKCTAKPVEGDTSQYDEEKNWFKTTTTRTDDSPIATQHFLHRCCMDQKQASCSRFYYKKPKTGLSRLAFWSTPKYKVVSTDLWVGNGVLYSENGWGVQLTCGVDDTDIYIELEKKYTPAPTWSMGMHARYMKEWYDANK